MMINIMTPSIELQHNDDQYNDDQHNDDQHNDTQYIGPQHNNIKNTKGGKEGHLI